MNIVADENVDKQIVDCLRANGHDVLWIAELDPGIDDGTVLQRCRERNAILVTGDKDFGELVFRQHLHHSGVMLIRLAGLTPDQKAEIVATALESHAEELMDCFSVVSRHSVRLRGKR